MSLLTRYVRSRLNRIARFFERFQPCEYHADFPNPLCELCEDTQKAMNELLIFLSLFLVILVGSYFLDRRD